MHYWKGIKQTTTNCTSSREKRNIALRSLSLEQEFLLTMMRIRTGILLQDLAFRFQISLGLVSNIFTTWVKFLSKELKWIITWPNRNIIKQNLPAIFRKYYPKCCVIIDCSELFIETPSSLDVAAMCWSNYKNHYTVKYLVGITPNGNISFLSDTYGGRASDQITVQDSSFLSNLQPGDYIMADRSFKVHDILAFYQCFPTIHPSKHQNIQTSKNDVKATSEIANVRIYVEQANKRMKDFRILKNEEPINILSLIDDILIICGALTIFLEPLCSK